MHRLARRFAACVGLAAVLFVSLPERALAFAVKDTQGKVHALAEQRGKWVVVNFWATWCAPCLKEIPELAAFYDARRDDVLILGVAVDDEPPERVKQVAARFKMNYPLVIADASVEKQFGKMRALPTTWLYDPSGKRVADQKGGIDRKWLERNLPLRKAVQHSASR